MHENVLVVDDDSLIRRVAERILARAGFRVAVAGSAAQALALPDPRFDVAILDYFLEAGECGCDLIAPLRNHNPSIRVVIMSGLGVLSGLIQHAHAAGADLVVSKSALDWCALAGGARPPPPKPLRPNLDLTGLKRDAVHGIYLVHHRNISSAARALGITRTSLQRVLRKMPPPRPDDE